MTDKARDNKQPERVERHGGYAPKGSVDVSKLPKGPAPGGEPSSQGSGGDDEPSSS